MKCILEKKKKNVDFHSKEINWKVFQLVIILYLLLEEQV